MNTSSPHHYPGCDPSQFTSIFGLFVQGLRSVFCHCVLKYFLILGILGSVALSFLIIKRYREPKERRRSWPVWIMDTSKQMLGMLFVHFANIAWASYISDKFIGDACSLYLLSFLFDSSLGLIVIYISLQIVELVNTKINWWMLSVGRYSDISDREITINCQTIRPWLVQTFIFLSDRI